MKVLLQSSVPFSQDIRSQLSQQAYQRDGHNTWWRGDLPYHMTNNPCFAAQHAQLLLQQLRLCHIPQDKPIHVFEWGAGPGIFAYYFIQAFERQCQEADLDYQLTYWLSDRCSENLEPLSQNPYFRALIRRGRLNCLAADLLNPQNVVDTLPHFDLMLMNYVAGHIPPNFYRWQPQSHWEQAWLETHLNLPLDICPEHISLPPETQENLIQTLKQSPFDTLALEKALTQLAPNQKAPLLTKLSSDRLKLLETNIQWNPAETPEPIAWWQAYGEKHTNRILAYPFTLIQGLKQWLQKLTPAGLCLISDQGFHQTSAREINLSQYGEHLIYPIDFPLLQAYFNALGFEANFNHNPLLTLHTLVLGPQISPSLWAHFNQTWQEENPNQFAADLIDCAEQAYRQERFRQAALLYQQALKYRPEDGRLHYQWAACLIELQAFEQAAKVLNQPYLDLYQKWDFAFQRGQVALFQGHYAEATGAFKTSIERFGPHEASYYNLGLAAIFQNAHQEAKSYFEQALNINPDHAMSREALTSWYETLA